MAISGAIRLRQSDMIYRSDRDAHDQDMTQRLLERSHQPGSKGCCDHCRLISWAMCMSREPRCEDWRSAHPTPVNGATCIEPRKPG